MDKHGGELEAADIWQIFSQTYLSLSEPIAYVKHSLPEANGMQPIVLTLRYRGEEKRIEAEGNGPIDAALHALRIFGVDLQVRNYEERSMGASGEAGDARACAFVELAQAGTEGERHGVGIHPNIVTASLLAIISGANRLLLR